MLFLRQMNMFYCFFTTISLYQSIQHKLKIKKETVAFSGQESHSEKLMYFMLLHCSN